MLGTNENGLGTNELKNLVISKTDWLNKCGKAGAYITGQAATPKLHICPASLKLPNLSEANGNGANLNPSMTCLGSVLIHELA